MHAYRIANVVPQGRQIIINLPPDFEPGAVNITVEPSEQDALPGDERAELNALAYLSDDTLWTIAREQMQSAKQAQLSSLMEKNSRGTISAEEHDALERLVEDGQRLMLRKSHAMGLLVERGYSVTFNDLKPAGNV